ncbi:MmgE/PrpD family protein [Haloarchaeobius sp. HME9146]|uniref:MmgE/PrpD family protein n=1 Tax=Haloarchaeobius sp. HME9146 TaxID=2978732 RepID=UPI0021BECEB0|nr:MmgE/PrpD family protein [Haloarchaeobius sp. HME9146]MCT9097828.1 MmgE/PrpD family protein [Haloarchaeobius sp. HME9146]
MVETQTFAEFVPAVEYDALPDDVVDELKKRVLDSLGIAVAALDAETTDTVFSTVTEYGRDGPCRLWGHRARASPDEATMHNTSLVRYLDFMDSFLAPGETPHPSDNIAAAIACTEDAAGTGKDLLEAIGVAYEVQGELAWNAPVRDRGWDHVTHTVISSACAAGKAYGLDPDQLLNAIGIAGTAHNALRVTRTGGINEWKGVASANAARNAVYATRLARHGMDGPTNLFEGQKGWQQVISGDFEVDLDPGCPRVFDTMTKRYVAETYAQSAVEGIIQLAESEDIDPAQVERIHLDTFAGAKLIIGGGEGSRYEVETKAQADHSLPYMLAAALADRELGIDAYDRDRIHREDVQTLLRTVEVSEDEALTTRFENGEMPALLHVTLKDGTTYEIEKSGFQGHPTDPMAWEQVEAKFHDLTQGRYDEDHRNDIVETVLQLEQHDVEDLVALLK